MAHDGDASGDGEDGDAPVALSPMNPIRRVFLQPERPAVYPEVVRSLLDADMIVIGPGSLFTSILPNLLVDDLARALCWSRAKKIYVCNVATQPGETDNYSVADHVRVIYRHLEERLGVAVGGRDGMALASVPFTHVLVNNDLRPHMPDEWGVTRPSADEAELAALGVTVIEADVVDESRPTRHDPAKLAAALVEAAQVQRASTRPAPVAAVRALAASLF